MKKNKNDIDTDLDVDIDIDESSELWSFRNKDDSSNRNNKKEVSNIDILTQKVNQALIKSTHKKHNIISEPNLKYFEEENKNLDFFKKSVEKELEIFESERKMQYLNRNKNSFESYVPVFFCNILQIFTDNISLNYLLSSAK